MDKNLSVLVKNNICRMQGSPGQLNCMHHKSGKYNYTRISGRNMPTILGSLSLIAPLACFARTMCLRAPQVVADEAKLAIVFTYFFLSFYYAFCFSPTSGNLPCVKICFPQYFGITRRYMQQQQQKLGNFF